MMHEKKTIVVLSFDASRTGAPILLLSFILASKTLFPQIDFKLFLLHGGPLYDQFKESIDTEILGSPVLRRLRRTRLHAFFERDVFEKIDLWCTKKRLKKFERYPWDINTFPALKSFQDFRINPKTVTWHFRELESTVAHFGTKEELATLASLVDAIIPDSYAVRKFLSDNGVKSDCMHVLHEYVNTDQTPVKRISDNKKFIVAGSGSPIWRKGFDIFLQSAISYSYQYPSDEVEFHWFGELDTRTKHQAQSDLAKAGIHEKVIFHGQVSNPIDSYAQADLLFATTREEPFGLIVLEAALGKVPCLAMDGVGGLNEFIEHAELVVPYMDIGSAVKKIHTLLINEPKRKDLGEFYFKKVQREYSVSRAAESILKIILHHQ